MYEKAMAQETRNGGTSTFNNNNGVDNSKKKLLIALDIFCLLLGESMNKFKLNWAFYSTLFKLEYCFFFLFHIS